MMGKKVTLNFHTKRDCLHLKRFVTNLDALLSCSLSGKVVYLTARGTKKYII
jgi:hypothetical protein